MEKDKTNEVKDEKMEDLKEEKEKSEEVAEAEEVSEIKDEKTEINALEEMEIQIGILKAEIEDLKQAYLRKQADFQNYSKRKEKEYEELKKYSSEEIIKKLLPEVDNFERAMGAAKDSSDFDALNKGVEMIFNHLQDILKSEGLEEIKAEGEVNPNYHHAVMIEEGEEHKNNEIVKVLQKGYTLKGRVIRPAMVSVCKK